MSQRLEQPSASLNVAILMFDRILLSSLGAFADLSAAATRHVHLLYGAIDPIPEHSFNVFDVSLLSTTKRRIVSFSGVPLPSVGTINSDVRYDIVIVPGFEIDEGAEHRSIASAAVKAWLMRQRKWGAVIAASGAATLVLGETGLARGLRVAIPWRFRSAFAERFPGSRFEHDRPITEDGGIFCSIGPGFDQALMLLLVERLVSPNLADSLSRKIGIDRPDQPLDPRHPIEQVSDPLIGQAQNWLQHRFPQAITIGELADTLAVSRRTLSRRFSAATGMTPLAYLHHLRIESAKQMLRRRVFRIKRIASLIGYSDVRYFKRLFQAKTGMSPHAYLSKPPAQR